MGIRRAYKLACSRWSGIAQASQAILYGSEYDGTIAVAIHQQKDAAACLKMARMVEAMCEIDSQYLRDLVSAADAIPAVPSGPANPASSPVLQKARDLVSRHVKLVAEDDATDACHLGHMLAQTRAGSLRGNKNMGEFVLVVYDAKVSGEVLRPPYRQPGWCQTHFDKLTTSAKHSRVESPGKPHDSDLFLAFDGGKPGLDFRESSKFWAEMRYKVLHTAHSAVMYEESLQVVTAGRVFPAISTLDYMRLDVPEDSKGPPWELPPNEKHAVFGGLNNDTSDDDDAVPVFPHSMPVQVAEGLIARCGAPAVLDLTAGDGAWAMACIRKQVPYTGIVFNQAHRIGLMAWLESQVQARMHDDDDSMCESGESSDGEPAAKRHQSGQAASEAHNQEQGAIAVPGEDDADTLER